MTGPTRKLIALAVLLFSGQGRGQSELERQIEACGQLSACTVNVPFGTYVVTSAWNLRDKASLVIRAPVGTQIVWYFANDPPPTLCMDTTGSRNIVIDGPTFALGNASKRPGVMWLHGRGADGKSQTRLSVSDASFIGWYTQATVVFVAVENELVRSVDFENGSPNTTALFLSRDNELGVVSPFGPVRVNPATMTSTNHVYANCSFNHEGHVGLVPPANNDNGYGITLGTGVHDLLIQGGSTSGGARGGVLRIAGQDNRRIAVMAANWESKFAKATVSIDGYAFGLSVERGLLQAIGPAVRINGTAENLCVLPAEMLTASIVQLGPNGKLTGGGLAVGGLIGK